MTRYFSVIPVYLFCYYYPLSSHLFDKLEFLRCFEDLGFVELRYYWWRIPLLAYSRYQTIG